MSTPIPSNIILPFENISTIGINFASEYHVHCLP
jgi:hypothetical protein